MAIIGIIRCGGGEKQTSPIVGGERGISLFLTQEEEEGLMVAGALIAPNLVIWQYSGRVEQLE